MYMYIHIYIYIWYVYIYIYIHVRIHPITPLFANVIHLFGCVFIVWSLSESQAITDHLQQAHVAPAKHDWLVVWLPCCLFSHSVGNLIIPIDVHIFQKCGPTTNQMNTSLLSAKSLPVYLTSRGIISNHTHILEQSKCHLSLSIGSRDLLVFSMPSIPLSAPPNT